MSLRIKFNLILMLTSAIGLAVAALISYNLFHYHAREEVLEKAALMIESAEAVRHYTVSQVRPLLETVDTEKFLPQTVPAYAANQYIQRLQLKHPDYSYREAALNPTNPVDRASDWEADIIEHFRNYQHEKELIGNRDTAAGPILFLSRPIKITNPECLLCHDRPADAPPSLIASYGSANGFGWKLNEIIGAQIVSVPKSHALERANREFFTFMASMIGVFLLIAIMLNLLLHVFVVKPVQNIARHADEVSLGNLDLPELAASGNDEMSLLSRSFNRMRRSLDSAMKMLSGQ